MRNTPKYPNTPTRAERRRHMRQTLAQAAAAVLMTAAAAAFVLYGLINF